MRYPPAHAAARRFYQDPELLLSRNSSAITRFIAMTWMSESRIDNLRPP
jgi:hypothetical protein